MLREPNASDKVPLPVELHRQNGSGHCGAACVQMIAAALGQPAEQTSQTFIFEGAGPGAPARAGPDWFMSPADVERQLAGVPGRAGITYAVRHFGRADALLRELESVTAAGWPSCLLGDGGAHWIVVHGTRRTAEGAFFLDIRDPWPPVTGCGPEHRAGDCADREFSAAWHLVFPAGLGHRVCPNQVRGPWYNRFVMVAVDPATSAGECKEMSTQRPAAPFHEGDEAAGIREREAEPAPEIPSGIWRAATAGARAAAAIGWQPLRGEKFVAGRMLGIDAGDWCGKKYCPVRGPGRWLVELHRANFPDRVLAVAVVDGASGSVLEMLAPAGGRSWIQHSGASHVVLRRTFAKSANPGPAS
jgi:hypothetical protein